MRYGMDEIVQVLGDAFLMMSSTWHTHRYASCDGQRLKPGFYLVLWPARVSSPGYDGHARYFGPLTTKPLAEQLKTNAASRHHRAQFQYG